MSDAGDDLDDERIQDDEDLDREDDEEGEDLDDEDGDEEDSEEDEDEAEERGTKKPKKKKKKLNRFIDDEAEVSDDEEEDEQFGDEDDLIQPDDDFDETINNRDVYRANRDLNKRREREEEVDAEEQARRFKEKYAHHGYRSTAYRPSENVASRMLLPSINDPSLWLVRCRQGYEKNLVIQLWRKFMDNEATAKMNILSILTRENLPGYLYIEARDKKSVDFAIDKVTGIYAQTVKVIPVEDMVACLRIQKKQGVDVKEGGWVRVKKGRYAGDLGKILEVLDGGAALRIKLIPRFDYNKDDHPLRAGEKRKVTSIPPQKLFNPEHVKGWQKNTYGGYIYQNEVIDADGYIEKDQKLSTLELEKVNPTLEEITRFQGGNLNDRGAGGDLDAVAAQAAGSSSDFSVGDNVEVWRGDLKDVTGRVVSLDTEFVSIRPKDAQLGVLRIDAKDLRKRFDEGDHVKVIHGNYIGETGMVIKIAGNVATVLSDSTRKTIQVFTKDLRGRHESSAASSQQSLYDIDDAVQINASDSGVVIKVENGVLSVMNQFGNVVKVPQQQILRKVDNKNMRATESQGRTLAPKDGVLVTDPAKNSQRRGSVIHIFRSFVFVKSREVMENGGLFVVRPNQVTLVSGPGMSAQANTMQGGFARPMAPPGGGGFGRGRRDPLINATVTIIGGPYKGYLGIVKDMTSGGARVELHTNSRTVTVSPDILKVHGSGGNNRPSFESFNRGGSGFDGGRTPGWSGGKTPNPYADGGRTPGWESGSRTPGWAAGGKTPAHNGGGWDSGSKTPAHRPSLDDDYGYGSRSSSSNDAETPFNPTTPHYETPYNPDTPGGYTMPQTPGSYPNAQSVSHHGGVPQTPGNPATPFDPTTPYNPTTPFHTGPSHTISHEPPRISNRLRDDWLTTDIEVTIRASQSTRSSFKGGQLDGQRAVIRAVENPRIARVIVQNESRSMETVPIEYLEPVRPEKKAKCKVLQGPRAGEVGEIIGIDEADGIVKLGNGIFEPIPLGWLAKYVAGLS
ncbi:hypothetical protein BC830DRAFT_1142403 [Chytriomyces sp. MP71]|nr:hypothetical protein BC830DRAFT_1142403 [Chytriomyces sp. MP71]